MRAEIIGNGMNREKAKVRENLTIYLIMRENLSGYEKIGEYRQGKDRRLYGKRLHYVILAREVHETLSSYVRG